MPQESGTVTEARTPNDWDVILADIRLLRPAQQLYP
jgi:hypothetical protein